jgi:HPt (histidine-containing phosphotransfer) domain-containing protein
MAEVIHLNTFQELKSTLGSDFMHELIDTYCEETPGLLAQLRQAHSQNDAETFQRVAHSIKSSSASLGANELAAQARQLEAFGRDHTLQNVDQKLDALDAMYTQVAIALKELAG